MKPTFQRGGPVLCDKCGTTLGRRWPVGNKPGEIEVRIRLDVSVCHDPQRDEWYCVTCLLPEVA